MELVKKHIHMNRRRNSVMTQITLDDDFNVPDSMDDVEQMILGQRGDPDRDGEKSGGRVTVGGKLNFRILYRRPDGQLMTLAGSIPFAGADQRAGAGGDGLCTGGRGTG